MRDKTALKAELIESVTAALETARAAHAAALEGATHSEARAENDKDTRGLEQSYLARGQAQRVAELEAGRAATVALALRDFVAHDPVALGAIVTVDEDGARHDVFIAPYGGGTVLGEGIQVVTPASPYGGALLGRRVDDEIDARLPNRVRSLTIVAIR